MSKIIYFIIPLMLMFVIGASAVVYDDEGKVISEEEIKIEMAIMKPKATNYLGCSSLIVGSCIGFWGFMSYALSGLGNTGADPEYIISITIGIGVAVITAGYIAGKNIDRTKAINIIKEKRRNKKQNEKESLIPESGIALPLLSGGF